MRLVVSFLLASHLVATIASAQPISLVKDLVPGKESSWINEFKELNGQLYFTAGSTLWKTDGTDAGTELIYTFTGFSILSLTTYNNKLYFIANDSIVGPELWTSDGTAAATMMVKDIFPGAQGGLYYPSTGLTVSSSRLRAFNGKLYFAANDGVHGFELWSTDGTSAGTSMVVDINPEPGEDGFLKNALTILKLQVTSYSSPHRIPLRTGGYG
jgi:ELWxxDGT repeat protein